MTAIFSGAVYNSALDERRLKTQIDRILELMVRGQWLTLSEIARITGDPESSISAQLRNLRKPEHGAHTIIKRHRGDPGRGLWEYCLIKPGYQADLFGGGK